MDTGEKDRLSRAGGAEAGPSAPKTERDLRAERLQAQLRANLKRRKEQARARAASRED